MARELSKVKVRNYNKDFSLLRKYRDLLSDVKGREFDKKDISSTCKIDYDCYNKYERRLSVPTLRTFFKICMFYEKELRFGPNEFTALMHDMMRCNRKSTKKLKIT